MVRWIGRRLNREKDPAHAPPHRRRALAAVYAATTLILVAEGMLAHAGCAFAAALIYVASCVPPPSTDRGSR